jgi:RNA polymerase sigma factor (sigma-70 family)
MDKSVSGTVLRAVRAATVASGATDKELLDRFTKGDQSAFAALVNRHAAMVLGVCRRALPTVQDAEDACQAVFLVLANRAKDGRWQESVANWLYTAARRIASKVNRTTARRARREVRVTAPTSTAPLDQMTGREALGILDEELDRLPARYREPLVLCYLEGLTRDEAAARLSVPVATLKSQLERGRKRLGDALTRRGVALGAGLLAVAVTSAARASPPNLGERILNAVRGSPSTAVAELTRKVAVGGSLNKVVRVLVALVGAVGGGIALGSVGGTPEVPVGGTAAVEHGFHPNDPEPKGIPPEQSARRAEKGGENVGATVTYRGRVLGPDGKPVAGAKLHMSLLGSPSQLIPPPECATADREGRFEFQVPREPYMDFWPIDVGATAATCGAGWVQIRPKASTDDLTIRLVNDNVPITGQIVTLEGKPVPGAHLTVMEIAASPKEDLGPWLEAVKGKKDTSDDLEFEYLTRRIVGTVPRVTTDDQGRFKLGGIGSNRLVTLRLEGPTIATRNLRVLTRPGEPLTVLREEGAPQYGRAPMYVAYYGANFRYPAAPTKPIAGVVRDRDTKKPLAGVTIQSHTMADSPNYSPDENVVRTTTDKDGRYRLVGMPCGDGNRIVVVPGRIEPYLVCVSDVPSTPGLQPVTVDFELKRVVWIEGKITDKATGQPLWSTVGYYARASNPNVRDHPGFERLPGEGIETQADGSYRVAGLPGAGFLMVWAVPNYLRAPQRDDEFGMPEDHLRTVP